MHPNLFASHLCPSSWRIKPTPNVKRIIGKLVVTAGRKPCANTAPIENARLIVTHEIKICISSPFSIIIKYEFTQYIHY